jgi:hypothetical protein
MSNRDNEAARNDEVAIWIDRRQTMPCGERCNPLRTVNTKATCSYDQPSIRIAPKRGLSKVALGRVVMSVVDGRAAVPASHWGHRLCRA